MAETTAVRSESTSTQRIVPTQTAKDHGVLLIPELLYEVISYLPFHDLLRCQRVSRSWNYAIEKSRHAQETLFLQKKAESTDPALSILLPQHDPAILEVPPVRANDDVENSNMMRNRELSTFLNPWIVQKLRHGDRDHYWKLTSQFFSPSGHISAWIRTVMPLAHFREMVTAEIGSWRSMLPAHPPSKYIRILVSLQSLPGGFSFMHFRLQAWDEDGVTLGHILGKLGRDLTKHEDDWDSGGFPSKTTLTIDWTFDEDCAPHPHG